MALCHQHSSEFWAQTLKKCGRVCDRRRACLWRPSAQPSVPVSSCAEWAPPPWGLLLGVYGRPFVGHRLPEHPGVCDLSVREPAPTLTLVRLTMAEMQMVLETGCPVSLVCQGRPESFSCTWGLGCPRVAQQAWASLCGGAGRVALAVVRLRAGAGTEYGDKPWCSALQTPQGRDGLCNTRGHRVISDGPARESGV